MHGSLLVAHHDVLEIRVLLESLADTGNIPVPENTQYAGEEGCLHAIAFHILVLEEADQCLGGG